MKKILLLAVVGVVGFLAWRRYSPQSRTAANKAAPIARQPTTNPAKTPVIPFLEAAPRVLNAVFGLPTVRAGEAPEKSYDPDYVRETFSMPETDYDEYRYAGIY